MGLKRIAMLSILAAALHAQPGIGQNGVVNAASRIPPSLPGGSIGRGAVFLIDGVRLGSAGHTSVAIVNGGRSVPVTVMESLPRRIRALMPADAPIGKSSLIVTVDQKAS